MFPKPSGPFAVGTLDRVIIDPARTNRYRYTPGTNAVFLQVKGADHFTAFDLAFMWQAPLGRRPALALDASVLWFYDAHLKGQSRSFPTNSEIYNVNRR